MFDLKRLKSIEILVKMKPIHRQIIPESSSARKEAVKINILVTSWNGDRKIMHFNRITSRPPVEPIQKNICQRNTFRNDLS